MTTIQDRQNLALLIGNSQFDDHEKFSTLRTPINDVNDFATVLKRYGKFKVVDKILNTNAEKTRQAIEKLYNQAQRGDLTLLYYSGHGYKDPDGSLYLAVKNTRINNILTTGISETFIYQAMLRSSSRHRIVILDCCFSGLMIKTKKSGEDLLLEKLKGEASAILASSSRIQYSFEVENGRNSLFTQYILRGIRSGQADRDKDGFISVDELFDYVRWKVKGVRPEQTPMLELIERESKIYISVVPKQKPLITIPKPNFSGFKDVVKKPNLAKMAYPFQKISSTVQHALDDLENSIDQKNQEKSPEHERTIDKSDAEKRLEKASEHLTFVTQEFRRMFNVAPSNIKLTIFLALDAIEKRRFDDAKSELDRVENLVNRLDNVSDWRAELAAVWALFYYHTGYEKEMWRKIALAQRLEPKNKHLNEVIELIRTGRRQL